MGVNPAAQAALDRLFSTWGSPLPVISAYRDPAHNARVGGAKNSQHTHGNAFDIDVSSLPHEERVRLAQAARDAGFSGFGFYDGSMHFDVGPARYWGPSYGADSTPAWAMPFVQSAFGQGAAGGTGGGSMSTKTPPAGLLGPAEPPRRPSIWDSFGPLADPDRRARLAIALEGMTLNPNAALINTLQEDMKGRAADKAKNRTIEWLRSRGNEDLAAAIAAGMDPDAAFTMAMQPPEARGQIVSAEQLQAMFPGAVVEPGLYNLKPDGTANKIGGASTVVNVGGEADGAFDKEMAKLTAGTFAKMQEEGWNANGQLGQINVIESLLATGAGGTSDALKLWVQENLGVNVGAGGNVEALSAVINQLVPQQRPPGSGQMSDRDVALFKSSLPQMINSPEGNAIIVQTMRGMAEFKRAQGEIASQVAMGTMTREQGVAAIQALPDPMAKAVAFIQQNFPAGGAAPTGGMSREDAVDLLLKQP